MQICIDARSPGQAGILNYTSCLLKSLLKIDQCNKYTIVTDHKHASWGYQELDQIVVPSLNPMYWMMWSNVTLPKILAEKQVDIYHSVKHVTAFHLKAKKLLTFQAGTMLYEFPELYKWYDLMYWKFSYSKAIKHYDVIITATKAENRYLTENLGFPESKFRVTNYAADDRFGLIENQDNLRKVKAKYGLPDRFILFVGRIHPQKNLERIIKAYYEAQRRLRTKHKLVVVGGTSGSYFERLCSLIQELGIGDNVHFTGYVSDDLPYIYNLADLFLSPSLYESFGMVFLEAMACGLAVIAPNFEEMDEVVGDAALRVNAADTSAIAAAIVRVLKSDQLKTSLRKRSLERANLFSWDRCARETIGIYEELVHGYNVQSTSKPSEVAKF